MKADAHTEAAVMATLEQFKQAYEQRDMARLLALFAPDPDVVLIGTGADEKRVGLAEIQTQAERDWSQSPVQSPGWQSTLLVTPGLQGRSYTSRYESLPCWSSVEQAGSGCRRMPPYRLQSKLRANRFRHLKREVDTLYMRQGTRLRGAAEFFVVVVLAAFVRTDG